MPSLIRHLLILSPPTKLLLPSLPAFISMVGHPAKSDSFATHSDIVTDQNQSSFLIDSLGEFE